MEEINFLKNGKQKIFVKFSGKSIRKKVKTFDKN